MYAVVEYLASTSVRDGKEGSLCVLTLSLLMILTLPPPGNCL